MWGEVYEPLVDDQWPHNPHFAENSHERPFSIIPNANTNGFLTKKWSPPEICNTVNLVFGDLERIKKYKMRELINHNHMT
jgi:hypothetical protein